MQTNTKRLTALKAGDVMSREIVTIRHGMSMWDAADWLIKNQVSGAPVVDENGKCVGVLSAVDFMRAARTGTDACGGSRSMPAACSFQRSGKTEAGEQVVVCTLPHGVCPIQKKEKDARGKEIMVCSEPHGVLADWQTVEAEDEAVKEVRRYMTEDPVTVSPDTPVRNLATRMIDARIHRIIVVDEQQRPIGVVSSTDVLALVAFAGDEPRKADLEG